MSNPPPIIVGLNVVDEMLSLLPTTPADGCIVEVGVYRGGTLWHFVQNAAGRKVFGYDTFTGIPYTDPSVDSHKVGDFGDTSFEEVSNAVPEATLLKGIFPETLVPMPPIAFAHIDCDQHQSVKACIDMLGPLMAPEGIMWFDDYGCLAGAIKAVDEAFGDNKTIDRFGKAYVRF